jgi:hypothetical protein
MGVAMSAELAPPYEALSSLEASVRDRGYAVLAPRDVAGWAGLGEAHLPDLSAWWTDLPADPYLRDGGHYRYRRHASLILDEHHVQGVPHRAHWQPEDYNALHGGLTRWFEPVAQSLLDLPAIAGLLANLSELANRLRARQRWFTEVHQFRIDTTGGIGRPTPEGAHRDGVDLVAVLLVGRQGVKGGESRVFEAQGPKGIRFTMSEPWTLLLLDDERVIHETTPIQPLHSGSPAGCRNTLVITLRTGGFQQPAA